MAKPYIDLKTAVVMVPYATIQAIADGTPEERADALRVLNGKLYIVTDKAQALLALQAAGKDDVQRAIDALAAIKLAAAAFTSFVAAPEAKAGK